MVKSRIRNDPDGGRAQADDGRREGGRCGGHQPDPPGSGAQVRSGQNMVSPAGAGQGERVKVAEKIKEIAKRANDIPIVENKPLAQNACIKAIAR